MRYPRLKPNPVPTTDCRACGHDFPTVEPDPGCGSPHRVPTAVLVAELLCETCYRRGVDETTVGGVNQRFGSSQRGPG